MVKIEVTRILKQFVSEAVYCKGYVDIEDQDEVSKCDIVDPGWSWRVKIKAMQL